MEIQTPELQIARMLEFLQTPTGIVSVLLLLGLLVLTLVFSRMRWVVLTLLLLFAPMAISTIPAFKYVRVISPLQQFRMYGRPICGAMLIILLVPTISTGRGWRMRVLAGASVALFILEFITSIRYLLDEQVPRAVMGLTIFVITFLVMGMGLPRWLKDMRDVRALIRTIAIAGIIHIGLASIQLLVNPAAIVAGRFYGLTGNPQHASVVFAATLLPVAFLAVWKEETKLLRVAWAVLAAVVVFMLMWTGSRTGALMAVVGLGLLFRRHIGRMLGFTLVAGVLVLFALEMFSDVAAPASRLLNTTNTRALVWRRMLSDFLSSPLLGRDLGETEGSENSYLLAAARLGIVGLIPLMTMVFLSFGRLINIHRMRAYLREDSLLADLVIGGMTALFVGAFFEGYWLGTITHELLMLYVYLALGGYLLDLAAVHTAQAQDPLWERYETESLDGLPVGVDAAALSMLGGGSRLHSQ